MSKVILVTGASRGLGRAICERLTQKGLPVIGISRNIEELPFPAIAADVTSYDHLKIISQKLKRDGVLIGGLVNAAGIASMNLAVTTPPQISKSIIETNLMGTIFCCQVFAPLMIRNKSGVIINFSTIAVALGLKGGSLCRV